MQSWYRLVGNIIIGICSIVICDMSFALEGIQSYQKNLHLSAEHKQKLAADIDRYYSADNLWDELRGEFSLSHYENNPDVQHQIDWYLNNQAFLIHSATRAAPYLYFILQQVRKRHLPAELALLPIIESAYNPFAYSSAGAAGIWQMMPKTASGLGIKQDWWYDGRRDVVASTQAALNYLSYLGSFFDGNWLWAIAAYDTGEGNVASAIRRNGQEGMNTDFWSLPLAQETREYIPRLMALAIIIAHPERYPIDFPAVPNAPYLAQVTVDGQIDLKHAADLAGLALDRFKQLNPGYNRGKTAQGSDKLILPIENVEQFSENLARSPLHNNINWIRYTVKSGDNIYTIAKNFNTKPSILAKANPLLAVKNLKPGSQLMIPKTILGFSKEISQRAQSFQPMISHFTKNHKFSTRTTKNTPYINSAAAETLDGHYMLRPGDTLYVVRTGDTLQKIATHFHTTTSVLMTANRLQKKVNVGDNLIIPTHQVDTPGMSPGDTVYIVRKGDTIEKVSKKFNTSAANVRLVNLLASNHLDEGKQIVIPGRLG
jgi:membrane-bound lytic murein transglycosylase D